MAPVIEEINRRSSLFQHSVVTTAQHREMLDGVLDVFSIKPDVDLGLMQQNQTLADFASRSLAVLSALFAELRPAAILVQGDTTTAMTAALAGFYNHARVGHVEAGLRSHTMADPFPEEANRRLIATLANLHFAPTERALRNLVHEGVPDENIYLTGNTIVDALQSIRVDGEFSDPQLNAVAFGGRRVLLVTAHRRENHGDPLRSICRALRTLTERFADLEVVFPVHLNPNVKVLVFKELGHVDRVHLVAHVSYRDLLLLLKRCFAVLTDSGGIQEEAPSFGRPVLVLRNTTERPELVEAGLGKVIGTESDRIVQEVEMLLYDAEEYARMTASINPFGDGRAAARIANILASRLIN
jgi:UDP-N-acetylglucosamine 2-epimerase (non-hydrolysing)